MSSDAASMKSVDQHYAEHLAPIYAWMAGGFESALSRGDAELNALCPERADGMSAVDLGAGFGMHAIPLAQRGCGVVAIDSSPVLLGQLQQQARSLPIRTVHDDLLEFQRHIDAGVELILCMGDTLTHLPDRRSVERLFVRAHESLRSNGRFIATFRDYATPLSGEKRFIPVRSDPERILTCFLEYSADHVLVHDLLHERAGAEWTLRVSAYRKLRLAPQWAREFLQAIGFEVRVESGLSGMARIVATKV